MDGQYVHWVVILNFNVYIYAHAYKAKMSISSFIHCLAFCHVLPCPLLSLFFPRLNDSFPLLVKFPSCCTTVIHFNSCCLEGLILTSRTFAICISYTSLFWKYEWHCEITFLLLQPSKMQGIVSFSKFRGEYVGSLTVLFICFDFFFALFWLSLYIFGW